MLSRAGPLANQGNFGTLYEPAVAFEPTPDILMLLQQMCRILSATVIRTSNFFDAVTTVCDTASDLWSAAYFGCFWRVRGATPRGARAVREYGLPLFSRYLQCSHTSISYLSSSVPPDGPVSCLRSLPILLRLRRVEGNGWHRVGVWSPACCMAC